MIQLSPSCLDHRVWWPRRKPLAYPSLEVSVVAIDLKCMKVICVSLSEIIDLSQPIYVCREDPDSRNTTIQAIKNRANSPEDWPPLMIFPEGTCTNREALISFKLGAFFPGVPIQPIVIRYPNRYDSFTWTWSGPGPMQLLWLTLTKGFTRVEVEYLPVYVPSEEEKANPKLFAKNVQRVMSK